MCQEKKTFTICFCGTKCTRDEGEISRKGSDMRIYCPQTGYIPVRIHKEISGTLDETNKSTTVRGVAQNDWQSKKNNKLILESPLAIPQNLLEYAKDYSKERFFDVMNIIHGREIVALALHGANKAIKSGAENLNFIGHSRGAVEAIIAAWFIHAYAATGKKCNINIFAIDPVPGPGNWWGILTQLPPNVNNYVGIYAWDQCEQNSMDKAFMALTPRPNGGMMGIQNEIKIGNSWESLADNCQLNDPLELLSKSQLLGKNQPQRYTLYVCRGRHSTVSGNYTADGLYDSSRISDEVAAVPKLVYKIARAYLSQWGTSFDLANAVPENVSELRQMIHRDHATLDKMGGGATRTSKLTSRPYVRRISSISGWIPSNWYYLEDCVGSPPCRLAYPVTSERQSRGWVKWKFL